MAVQSTFTADESHFARLDFQGQLAWMLTAALEAIDRLDGLHAEAPDGRLRKKIAALRESNRKQALALIAMAGTQLPGEH